MVPTPYRIVSYESNTDDTFTVSVCPKEDTPRSFLPGQFNMIYLFGFGEIPVSMSGDPLDNECYIHTIRMVGPLTRALGKLRIGDEIGIRGPFGTSWPLSSNKDHLLIIAGGVGLAPLRPVLLTLQHQRCLYKTVTLLYGARSPKDILFTKELLKWEKEGIRVITSVDSADTDWKGNVGVIPKFIEKQIIDPKRTRALLCGPEIMMKFSLHSLMRAGIPKSEIFLSIERNMKCAVGFCGHCQYGPYFICKNGPVFSYDHLEKWMQVEEL